MVLLPFLTFKNYKQQKKFCDSFPQSQLQANWKAAPPFYMEKKEKVYYKFLYFLLVHFIGANLKNLIFF